MKLFIPRLWIISALVASIIVMQSCAPSMPRYSSIELAYMDRAADSPLDFIASKERADEAWGRGQAFLGRFPTLRIQFANEYVVQAQPPEQGTYPGLVFTRSPKGDSAVISIGTIGYIDTNAALRLEHVAAYYMLSGEEPAHALFANLESIEMNLGGSGTSSGWVWLSAVVLIVLAAVVVAGAAHN